MRKIFVTMAALIMALVMSVTAFGCNLIKVDDEKDMAQVVAVVQVEESSPKEENTIYKKDVVLAYLNYGYYYEQNYGYSRQQVIELIMNNLITNRIYVQVAMLDFDKGEGSFAGQIANSSITDKWDIERYLTEDELVEATYLARQGIDELIHSYQHEHGHDHGNGVGDTITDEVRTIPTGATNAADKEEEPTIDEMKSFVIDVNSEDSRKKAYNDVIELLDDNNLLGEYKNDIEETDYFKQTLKGYQEQILIEKYEKCIIAPVHAKYTLDNVRSLFNEKLQAQKDLSDTEYASALSSATSENPILYAPTGTYGYVYNLLLGVSSEQSNELKEFDANNPNATDAERSAARKEILDKTIVKDLRSTWIMSGYDFDGTKFTGDYTFTSAENSLKFFGETKHLNPEDDADHGEEGHVHDEDYVAEYGVTKVDEMSVSEFVKMMEEYVYGSSQDSNVKTYTDSAVYRAVNTSNASDDYNDKINELLFAFSTDGGSLNTYKGYTIAPAVDGSNQEQYMYEFAEYGREVLNGAVGDKGYIMVATDYGYHIMFYSEVYNVGEVYADLDAYLAGECAKYLADSEMADWNAYFKNMQDNWSEFEDTANYLYVLYNQLVSNEINVTVNKYQNDLLNKYYFGEDSKVVKYEDRYSDLYNA